MAEEIRKLGEKVPVAIEEELKRSYLDYAMSVIIGRALPDVRDGLKPVHRRILYGMWEAGNRAGRPYKKSARIVGDVMGKYHPHGDAAIYDALVRMAQPFSMRHVLVDGQGNFGSIDGDSPAAMRYTEVRLTPLAEEMLGEDLDKETVDWQPNYDGTLMEPVVLPARFPNLLVNGSSGIAVGMATNIPPHNLGEVVDACIALARNPSMSVEELMAYVPGPDFPTGAFIRGTEGIRKAYTTGRGRIKLRARAFIERDKAGRKASIVVRELPYQVNKARLVEQIARLVQSKKLEGIADLRDESDREGTRVVIELRRDAQPKVVLNRLFKLTQLEVSYTVIFLGVLRNQPRLFNLKELLEAFLQHRRDVVIRRARFELAKARERLHILEGLVAAVDKLDLTIKTIRESRDPSEAKARLMEVLGVSERQATAILEMRLQRLTGLEREKLLDEHAQVLKRISELEALLSSKKAVTEAIITELEEIRDKYADERRTEIVPDDGEITEEDLIAEEEAVVTITRGGYVKRTSLSVYRAQRRGGRGRRGMATKEEDAVQYLFVASTHSLVLFFTSLGRVFSVRAWDLPDVGPNSRGRALVNILNLAEGENVTAVVPMRSAEFDENRFLFFATRLGRVKRTRLSEFANIKSSGIKAIEIAEGDELMGVQLTDGRKEVLLGTKRGMAIRFLEEQVRPMGRQAAGVLGMRLAEGDQVEELACLPPGAPGHLLVVTASGYAKRTPAAGFRLQNRGGSGVKLITLKGDEVAGVRWVDEKSEVLVISASGMIIRTPVSEIPELSRNARGVRIIRLEEGDRVVAVARLAESS